MNTPTNEPGEEGLCALPGLDALRACVEHQVRGVDAELMSDPGLGILRAAELLRRHEDERARELLRRIAAAHPGFHQPARWLAALDAPPPVVVSASAIGYYGVRGDEELQIVSRLVDRTGRKLVTEAARVVRTGGVIAFTDWIEGPAGLSDEEAARINTFMKFPYMENLEGYKSILDKTGFELVEATDLTEEFAGYIDFYIKMLTDQLSTDALRIIGTSTGYAVMVIDGIAGTGVRCGRRGPRGEQFNRIAGCGAGADRRLRRDSAAGQGLPEHRSARLARGAGLGGDHGPGAAFGRRPASRGWSSDRPAFESDGRHHIAY